MGLVLEKHSKHLTGQLATILIPLVHYISNTCTKKISWILGPSYYQQSITPIKRSLKISKKSFSILENHIVSTVEAYGACFCWKIYSDTKFRGEVQEVSEGDEIEVEDNVGSIEKFKC